jgi:deoxycytidylate deaminase
MHEKFFNQAANVARGATCHNAKCGSVIVSEDGVIIGRGFNAPPLGDESQRMCDQKGIDKSKKPGYDKTCCVHAEWNAIIDALATNAGKVKGSTLYFMRISDDGSFTDAGAPYCTVCSRLALQSGIAIFGLWNDGPQMFDTKNYNQISYDFYK